MRVLMVNHPDCQAFRGGDLVQMEHTAAALRQLGVVVEFSFDLEPSAAGFDVAHVFNVRTVGATPQQVAHLKRQGLPVVLSPIYLNPSFGLWGTRVVTGIFQSQPTFDELPKRLAALASRELKAKVPDAVFTADGVNRPLPEYDDLQRRILAGVDHLIPNSLLEMHALTRALRVAKPFTVSPLGVDPFTFLDPDPQPFVERFGLRDFVLEVARIEGTKNQVLLCCALRDAGLPLVLIGGTRQPQYQQWCREYGPKDLLMLDHQPPEVVCSAYAAARVHVLPSWSETCGLVNLEAALAGCSLVAGMAGYEMEYLRDGADYCDPAGVSSIRDAVLRAWHNHAQSAERRARLKARVLSEFTWERAAETTLRAYARALGSKAMGHG